MTDLVDEVQDREIAHRERAVRAVQLQASDLARPWRADCIDCDDEIEADRRRALPGARRCLRCQTLRERLYPGTR